MKRQSAGSVHPGLERQNGAEMLASIYRRTFERRLCIVRPWQIPKDTSRSEFAEERNLHQETVSYLLFHATTKRFTLTQVVLGRAEITHSNLEFTKGPQ